MYVPELDAPLSGALFGIRCPLGEGTFIFILLLSLIRINSRMKMGDFNCLSVSPFGELSTFLCRFSCREVNMAEHDASAYTIRPSENSVILAAVITCYSKRPLSMHSLSILHGKLVFC